MHESCAHILQDADIVHQHYTDSVQVMELLLDLDRHIRLLAKHHLIPLLCTQASILKVWF